MFVFSDDHNCVQEFVDKRINWTRSFVNLGIEPTFAHPREIDPHWSHPEEGYVKLNIDGVVFSSKNCASIEGVIRDATGDWQCGFAMTFGEGSIFQVEVRAMLEGLAWHGIEGIKN